ncbi:hypothetical protein Csa_003883 [Cucumis sativus]|uniref:Uncharacterized protein n=1 Tax=Cucumis sativus TaxID=3659 RepID=A0A0A0KIQ6_CUCSA|nr:hypothetical protein Csa_003883 [Cucumis sativus]
MLYFSCCSHQFQKVKRWSFGSSRLGCTAKGMHMRRIMLNSHEHLEFILKPTSSHAVLFEGFPRVLLGFPTSSPHVFYLYTFSDYLLPLLQFEPFYFVGTS